MTGRHPMWDGDVEATVDVPTSGGENVMVPVIRAVVRDADRHDRILLQRRDDASERVRGLIEIPGGRWRAGESPLAAVTREIEEETGLALASIAGIEIDRVDDHRAIASLAPLVVVAGIEGAFPAVHVVLVAEARGTPRAFPGESADVRWWDAADVRHEMRADRGGFIPSSFAALAAYFDRYEA